MKVWTYRNRWDAKRVRGHGKEVHAGVQFKLSNEEFERAAAVCQDAGISIRRFFRNAIRAAIDKAERSGTILISVSSR